jgi:hypothetical protein
MISVTIGIIDLPQRFHPMPDSVSPKNGSMTLFDLRT